jgi:hypothetical protein
MLVSVGRELVIGASNSKPHWKQQVARAPLISKLVSEVTTIAYELSESEL